MCKDHVGIYIYRVWKRLSFAAQRAVNERFRIYRDGAARENGSKAFFARCTRIFRFVFCKIFVTRDAK